jgi:lysophospholipase L1-like esterase
MATKLLTRANIFPNPAGIRLAALGDSHLAKNHKGDNSSPTGISNEINGELTWARITNPCFIHHVVYDNTKGYADARAYWGLNEAIGGETTAEILARVDDVIRKRPDACYVQCGGNDISSVAPVISFDTITTNLTAIVTALREAGIVVILGTIPPRPVASWSAGSVQRKKYNRVNSWIRDAARRLNGVFLHDVARHLTDPTSTDGIPVSGAIGSDNIHLTPTGARLSGVQLGTLLGKIFPTGSLEYIGGRDDLYDATDNPLGNLISNGRMNGTTGTLGAGASGASGVATGWTIARTTGSTVTCVASKEAGDTVLGDLQVLTFTLPGGGTGNDVFMLTGTVTTGPVEGEWVQGGIHMKLTATAVLADSLLFIRNAVDTTHSCQGFRNDALTNLFPNAAIDGPIITEPFLVPASPGAWTFRQEIRMPAASVGSVVLKFGNAWFKKIENPHTMWNNVTV